ncbi:electron-transferring-flavoprotein dehydrogenase, partial [Consotaella salsifontis]
MSIEPLPERESMEFDVVIVGAGPAGLSAAIRLKQLDPDLSVVVLEKGSEVGAHILSGCVLDPSALDRLLPEWRGEGGPDAIPVKAERFHVYGPHGGIRLPTMLMPKLMHNRGCFVVELGPLCRWLAEKAEALGVEVYPGFAACELILDADGAVVGVATGDMGIERNGTPGPNFQRGMALLGKYVLIGEGARGSLSKELMARYGLGEGREPQKFGIGLKEVWEIDPA